MLALIKLGVVIFLHVLVLKLLLLLTVAFIVRFLVRFCTVEFM